MASKATLSIFPAETCLIDKLVASLIDRDERDFSKTAVILPTQRLGTHLLARLARHLGAFRPPKVWTLESLLLLSRKEDSHLPISDAAADFMIQNILKDGTFQQLRPGHEREIRLIMGEMYENCVEESAFKDAIDSLDKDVYHDSQHVDGLFVRLSECLSVIKSFQEHILQSNFVIKQRFMAELCKDNNLDLLLSPFESIYLIGYTSIAPSWRTAVLRMCKNPNVNVWLSEKPDIYQYRFLLEFSRPS